MWPWDHLALGYIGLSVYSRSRWKRPPRPPEPLALLIGTQFPDLLDKPLAWQFGLLPSGSSLFHSAFTALSICGLVLLWSRSTRTVAFSLGYLLHLPGDVLYPALVGNGLWTSFLLWPLVPASPTASTTLLAKTSHLIATAIGAVQTPEGWWYLFGAGVELLVAVGLWQYDGRPGLRTE